MLFFLYLFSVKIRLKKMLNKVCDRKQTFFDYIKTNFFNFLKTVFFKRG